MPKAGDRPKQYRCSKSIRRLPHAQADLIPYDAQLGNSASAVRADRSLQRIGCGSLSALRINEEPLLFASNSTVHVRDGLSWRNGAGRPQALETWLGVKTMDAIERYLNRIRYWLPVTKQHSIVSELRGVLLDRVEAASARNGRPLTDKEAGTLARAFGTPVVVAARYVEGSAVISGTLAYFFWRVLAIAMVTTLTIQFGLFVAELWTAPQPGSVIGRAAGRTVDALLLGFACVTGSFMIIERWGGRSKYVGPDD